MEKESLKPEPREMTNEELCGAWEAVNDHDKPTPADRAIIEEMERRHIEY